MRRSNILKSEKAMKTTMSALAAVALVAATDVRAQETGSSNTVQLPGSKDAKVTLVYQRALPGIPGKSVKGVLGPAATRLRIRTRSRRSSTNRHRGRGPQ
jgi:hypothetical protein